MDDSKEKELGMKDVLSKGFVKQSNSFTNAQFSETSLHTKRIMAYLISTIPDGQIFSLETFFRTSAEDFFKKILESVGNKNKSQWFRQMRSRTKKSIKELISMNIIRSFSREDSIDIEGVAIIPYCRFYYTKDRKEFVYQFHPLLKDYLLDLKNKYTTYDLVEYISLSSAYSMRMYELLAKYKDKGRRIDTIDALKFFFNCEERYSTRDFLLRVIESAKKDLSETSYAFDYKLKVKGEEKLFEPNSDKIHGKKIEKIEFKLINFVENQEKKENPFEDFAFWKNASVLKRKNITALWKFGIHHALIIKNIEILSDDSISDLVKKFYKLQTNLTIKSLPAYRTTLFKSAVELALAEQGFGQELIENNGYKNHNLDIITVFNHLNIMLSGKTDTEEISDRVMSICLDDINLTKEIISCKSIEELEEFIVKYS